MTDDNPQNNGTGADELQDGKVPPTPELEDADHADTDDIAIPTPLEQGDPSAQTV